MSSETTVTAYPFCLKCVAAIKEAANNLGYSISDHYLLSPLHAWAPLAQHFNCSDVDKEAIEEFVETVGSTYYANKLRHDMFESMRPVGTVTGNFKK